MTSSARSIDRELASLVESSALRDFESLAPLQQLRLARAGISASTSLVYPKSESELAAVIACAHRNRWQVLPCGRLSRIDWGKPAPAVDLVVSTERLDRVIEHAVGDLTVTAEAGISFGQLQVWLAEAGQFLALDPAYPEQSSLGGVLATAESGSMHHRYGGVRDQCLGITFVRSDGEIVKAGGRVVKNVAGYDLMKLLAGSYGTLGIITAATFRLYPVSEYSGTVLLTGPETAVSALTAAILASALTPTAIDLVGESLLESLGFQGQIGLAVRFASIRASVTEQLERVLALAPALKAERFELEEESHFWEKLHAQFWQADPAESVICKVGVRPVSAPLVLGEIRADATGWIRAGSGIGLVRWPAFDPVAITRMRQFCQARGGYLTVLEAPKAGKSQIDVWGYTGNALELMKRLQQQFDPQKVFSPARFVG